MKFKITYIDNSNNDNTLHGDNTNTVTNNVTNQFEEEEISETDILVTEYIESLNDNEKKALIIARQHLETSFCIEKSNGFINWMKNRK